MRKSIAVAAALIIAAPACAQSAASGALEESAEAVGAGLEASVKTASGVAAIPIASVGVASMAVGSVAEGAGRLTGEVGEETMEAGEAAAAFAGEPLSVDDDIIVAPMPEPDVPYDARRAN